MHLPRRAIGQHDVEPRLALLLQRDEDAPPQTFLAAAFEARIDAVPVAVAVGQIAPRTAHTQHIMDSAKHLIMADLGRAPFSDITALDQGQNRLPKKLRRDRIQALVHWGLRWWRRQRITQSLNHC